MNHLRQTLVWLCSTILVVSSLVGQGVVLCIPVGEFAQFELSADNGKCVRSNSAGLNPVEVEKAGLLRLTANHHECEDIALAEVEAHFPVWAYDTLLTTPVFNFSAALPNKESGVEIRTTFLLRRLPVPDPRSTDVHAIRSTVTLLI